MLGIHARKTKSVTKGVNKSRRKYCSTPAISVLGRRRQEDSGCSATWADRTDYCFLGQWPSNLGLNFTGSCVCLQDTNSQVRKLGFRSETELSSDLFPSFLALRCSVACDRVSCSLDRPHIHYVAKDDIELLILLSLPRECWDGRHVRPHLVLGGAGDQTGGSAHARLYQLNYVTSPGLWDLMEFNILKTKTEKQDMMITCQ